MARHWNPDDDLARVRDERRAAKPAARLPEGAAAGLAMVAIACVCLGVLLYRLAGPRDIVIP